MSGVGGRPLPPPKDAAALLRTKAISILENWDSKFGDSYRQVSIELSMDTVGVGCVSYYFNDLHFIAVMIVGLIRLDIHNEKKRVARVRILIRQGSQNKISLLSGRTQL